MGTKIKYSEHVYLASYCVRAKPGPQKTDVTKLNAFEMKCPQTVSKHQIVPQNIEKYGIQIIMNMVDSTKKKHSTDCRES